jgi:hypothetical protein
MERKLFQIAAGLTWLALPLTALHYWRAWDRLPMRVAVHFDINWQPNGWTSRQGSLMLALGVTAFLLVIFTIAGYATSRTGSSSLSKWGLVVVFYFVLGFVYYINAWIVDRNLNRPQSAAPSGLNVFRGRDVTSAAGIEFLKPHS